MALKKYERERFLFYGPMYLVKVNVYKYDLKKGMYWGKNKRFKKYLNSTSF